VESVRIIPRLDIKGPNLIKGIHLEGLRVLGTPAAFAERYYESGADELLFMDAVASLYDRNSLTPLIQEVAERIFIPLTVGGGLRTIDDVRTVLRAGADKVAINTAAVDDPELITELASEFGTSTIVIGIEAIEQPDGSYEAFCENGRTPTGRDAVAWAREAVDRGAGELLVTSVDREGTGQGFDESLIADITSHVDVPVIAHGGAGSPADCISCHARAHPDGFAVSSMLHYHLSEQRRATELELVRGREEGNLEYLSAGAPPGFLSPMGVVALKSALADGGVPVRGV
jgi:cyclase